MHWWAVRRNDYGWLTPSLERLYRDFGPEHAEPLLAEAQVDAVILVQAAPTVAETRYLLDLARSRPYVLGVVGWADLAESRELESFAQTPGVVAIRPMLQDLPQADWILRPELAPALQLMQAVQLPLEALITLKQLPYVRDLIDRYPQLPILIDHAAKPAIGGGFFEEWCAALATLAAIPHVYCKLSGLVTEASAGITLSELLPYARTIFELFGPGRVIWGSDWPVLTQRLDYLTWKDWSKRLTRSLLPADQRGVFGANAQDFYGARLRALHRAQTH